MNWFERALELAERGRGKVEDHPLHYGDFEGTIPKGQYGGGTVQPWDRGYWLPEGSMTPQQGFAKGDLKFTLEGERLHGSWVLVRMRQDRNGGKRNDWLLIKHRDDYASDGRGEAVLGEDRSIASGRSMADIAAADIAIRKRTADLRAMRLAKEAADRDKPVEPKAKSAPKKKKST